MIDYNVISKRLQKVNRLANECHYIEAIKYFSKSLEKDPNNAMLLYKKGYALSPLGKYI